MDQKRYETMHSIMEFSRIFADQMLKCMENAGMIDDGFHLDIRVGRSASETRRTFSQIELERSRAVVEEEEWLKSAIEQEKFDDEKWMVYHDPYAKKGLVPPVVRTRKSTEVYQEGVGTLGDVDDPLDGLWFSSRDNYSDVVGG